MHLGFDRLELPAPQELQELLVGEVEAAAARGRPVQWHIRPQRDERPRAPRCLGKLEKRRRALRGFHTCSGLEHTLKIGVVGEELCCALGPHARHAWHVVARVAHQSEKITQLRRTDAKLCQNRRRVDDDLLLVIPHDDAGRRALLAHQLHQVLVASDDHHRADTRLARIRHACGDHVVCLKPLSRKDRQAKVRASFLHPLNLGAQRSGHRRALRLV